MNTKRHQCPECGSFDTRVERAAKTLECHGCGLYIPLVNQWEGEDWMEDEERDDELSHDELTNMDLGDQS
jgi:hypothetical protein